MIVMFYEYLIYEMAKKHYFDYDRSFVHIIRGTLRSGRNGQTLVEVVSELVSTSSEKKRPIATELRIIEE